METYNIDGRQAEIHVIPLKGVSIVFAKTDKGMIGCGVFDVMVLDKWGYPAVKMKGNDGPIADKTGLLTALAVQVNESAKKLGIQAGMTGAEALSRLW